MGQLMYIDFRYLGDNCAAPVPEVARAAGFMFGRRHL